MKALLLSLAATLLAVAPDAAAAERGVPGLDLAPRSADPRPKEGRSSCEAPGRSLCYDPGSNRIVYRKTREYMPELPGLRREHIAVRRDRVTFKYSFQQGARRRRRAPPTAMQSNRGPR